MPLNFAAHSPEMPTQQNAAFCAPPTDRTGQTASVQNGGDVCAFAFLADHAS
jgi:hypothetical protein